MDLPGMYNLTELYINLYEDFNVTLFCNILKKMHRLKNLVIIQAELFEQEWLHFICEVISVFESRVKVFIIKFESDLYKKYTERLKIERKNRDFYDRDDHEIKISFKVRYFVTYNFGKIFDKVHALVQNKMKSYNLCVYEDKEDT